MGTIGGNVANGSPIGDTPPALIALGATLHLRRGDAAASMPLEDFFIAYGRQDRAPGEFVDADHGAEARPGTRFRAYKVTKRFDQDISAVMGAFGCAWKVGSSPRPASPSAAWRRRRSAPRRSSRRSTAGPGPRRPLRAAQAAMAQDFTPLSDMRASAAYRLTVASNLLERLFVETTATGGGNTSRRGTEPRPCLTAARPFCRSGTTPIPTPTTRTRTRIKVPMRHDSAAQARCRARRPISTTCRSRPGLLHVYLGLSARPHARIARHGSRAGARRARRRRSC